MKEFERGLFVSKLEGNFRNFSSGLYFKDPNSLLSTGINPCFYKYTLEVIENLRNLTPEKKNEFEWGGGERAWFISKAKTTIATDNFGWAQNIELPTSSVIKMMQTHLELMKNWQKFDILNLLGKSFELIKNHPQDYIENKVGKLYCVKYNLENIKIVLLEEDFNLNMEQFISTVKFDNNFFQSE